MDQKLLQAQSEFISIQKQIDQTISKGKELQKKIYSTLISAPYDSLVKAYDFVDSNKYLGISMLGNFFTIYVETSFDENLRLTDGFLNTYFQIIGLDTNKPNNELIYSMPFDRIGNINRQYTIDDFAIPYLMNLNLAYVNRISELYKERKYMVR